MPRWDEGGGDAGASKPGPRKVSRRTLLIAGGAGAVALAGAGTALAFALRTHSNPPKPPPPPNASFPDDGPLASARFNSPQAVVADHAGNLYVADSKHNRIRKITPSGQVTTFAGTGDAGLQDGQAAQAQFDNPTDLAFDAAGNLYVADSDNQRVRRISTNGTVTTIGTDGSFVGPAGITVDPNGTVYVADVDDSTSRIRKSSPPYSSVATFAGAGPRGYLEGAAGQAKFDAPSGLALDKQGNLFVADENNNRVRKVTPDGTVSTFAGGDAGFAEGNGSAAKFNDPVALAFDSSGTLYVTDIGNYRIRKITPSGAVTTVSGSGGIGAADGAAGSATFGLVLGITVAPDGAIYVADANNNRIRRISSNGTVSTLAGTGPTATAAATAPTAAPPTSSPPTKTPPTATATALSDAALQSTLEKAAVKEGDLPSGYKFQDDSTTNNTKVGESAFYEESFNRAIASSSDEQNLAVVLFGYRDVRSARDGYKQVQTVITGSSGSSSSGAATAISGGPQVGEEWQSYRATVSGESGYVTVWRRAQAVVLLSLSGKGAAAPRSIDDLAATAMRQDAKLRSTLP